MKLKNLIITLGLSLTVGAGVAVGVASNNYKEANAATTWYYLGEGGGKNATDWSWNNGDVTLTEGTTYTFYFSQYEKFKILNTSSWGGTELTSYQVSGSAKTSGHFGGSGDITCNASGFYKIKVASSSSLVIEDLSFSDITGLGDGKYAVYAFTNNKGWSNVYVYAWGSSTKGANMFWNHSLKLTATNKNESNQDVYYFVSPITDYTSLIFKDGEGDATANAKRTGDVTIGSDFAWYCNGTTDASGQQNVSTWNIDREYYFYDYANYFNWAPKLYAWGPIGNSVADTTKAVDISTATHSSGKIYWFSLPAYYSGSIITNGQTGDGEKKTADMNLIGNAGNVYTRWSDGSGVWQTYNNAMAHDWVDNTMHLWDYDSNHDNSEGTNACYGPTGYYQYAKECYDAFDNDIRTAIASQTNYALAEERFIKWGKANNETVTFSESNGTYSVTYSSSQRILGSFTSENGGSVMGMIIIVSSIILLTAVSYYFFKKSRKA